MITHILDFAFIAPIVGSASYYLYRLFKKAKQNCGGLCSGCQGSCQTKVKQFKAKVIPIKSVS